jgi:sRNA-binding regulator protein Hfq
MRRIALKFMPNLSHISARDLREVRADAPAATPPEVGARGTTPDTPTDGGNTGPRKLVRPTLPARALRDSGHGLRAESPLLAHQSTMTAVPDEASHAEAFYFQKQVQMQTLMTFVLEDGEQIEGYIEWYDRHVIKVRNGSRTLIYKSSIKYLYKTGEGSGQ